MKIGRVSLSGIFKFTHIWGHYHNIYAFGRGGLDMRFLVDECTGPAVARWLQRLHHDVFSVYDEARD